MCSVLSSILAPHKENRLSHLKSNSVQFSMSSGLRVISSDWPLSDYLRSMVQLESSSTHKRLLFYGPVLWEVLGEREKKYLCCAWDLACAQEIKCQRNRRTTSAFYPFYQFCTSIRSTKGHEQTSKWLLKKLQIVKTWQDKRDSSQEMVTCTEVTGHYGEGWSDVDDKNYCRNSICFPAWICSGLW